MKPQLYWIATGQPGRLAIAPRPRGGDWLEDEARSWRVAGVDAVVSLLEPDEEMQLDLASEHAAVESSGMRYIPFPIPDLGIPKQTATGLLTDISEHLAAGRNVIVHCRQGVGRSGMITAAVLVNLGAPAEQAFAIVSAARGVTVPETPDQVRWLKGLSHLVAG